MTFFCKNHLGLKLPLIFAEKNSLELAESVLCDILKGLIGTKAAEQAHDTGELSSEPGALQDCLRRVARRK